MKRECGMSLFFARPQLRPRVTSAVAGNRRFYDMSIILRGNGLANETSIQTAGRIPLQNRSSAMVVEPEEIQGERCPNYFTSSFESDSAIRSRIDTSGIVNVSRARP